MPIRSSCLMVLLQVLHIVTDFWSPCSINYKESDIEMSSNKLCLYLFLLAFLSVLLLF